MSYFKTLLIFEAIKDVNKTLGVFLLEFPHQLTQLFFIMKCQILSHDIEQVICCFTAIPGVAILSFLQFQEAICVFTLVCTCL
jgi:hypothetical protein